MSDCYHKLWDCEGNMGELAGHGRVERGTWTVVK